MSRAASIFYWFLIAATLIGSFAYLRLQINDAHKIAQEVVSLARANARLETLLSVAAYIGDASETEKKTIEALV